MSRSANYRKKGKGNKHNGGGFRHSKSLGQNFLEDMDIVREIVEGSMVDRDTVVIEIGPGQGVLTAELAEEAGLVKLELTDGILQRHYVLCALKTKYRSDGMNQIFHQLAAIGSAEDKTGESV